ncbi:tudor domain-containing 6 [Syngnathus typhle]|uniref:tudor domain-containing 6 n=1 Tax=Syngnathus typhle TaxID=161592 RepID=UPI002A69C2DB|nr:tudor domain-containing 6 [Syngnathus typhle]
MCSIPGLPTPGSEVTIEIRRVNTNPKCGLVELWVNIDVSRKQAYDQMKKKIQLPKRNLCASEGKIGDMCLVCMGNVWHRARIVSIQSDTCQVFLLDQGEPYVSTRDSLAWGHSDSFFLPPEIESCILANVLSLKENWSKKAISFLSSLPEKTLNGVVQHVLMPDRTILLDIPFVSKQMCTLGAMRKLPADEFKGVVLECLTPLKDDATITAITQDRSVNVQLDDRYFYPELLCGVYETVYVTEVTDPQNVFCSLLIYSKALKSLSEEIQEFYKDLDSGGERPQTCGDPCAARGNNGTWYRSLLKQSIRTDDELVEVAHVDVGKNEHVSVGCIRHMARKFLRMPVVTYHFSLHGADGTRWTAKQNKYLKSILLNKTFVVKLEKQFQDTYSVTFYGGNVACMTAEVVPSAQDEAQQTEIQITTPSGEQDDEQNLVILNVKSLLEEPLSSTENELDTGTSPSSLCHEKTINDQCSKVSHHGTSPSSLCHEKTINDQCSKVSHHEHVLSVGSTVDVTVSCVEGPQKFWCQRTINEENLRRMMEDLQNHYTSVQPLPIVKGTCVARNPEDGVWYRARIVTSQHFPEVDVQFLDYGGTRSVPLGDVCPIEPGFLEVEPQAFQCCLFNTKANSASAVFPVTADSQNTGFKCTIKDIICDEGGQPVIVVDFEMPAQSACSLLSPMDTYNYSIYDIKLGTKEKAWITSSETVHSFFCQLDRNSHLFDKVKADIKKQVCKSQRSDELLKSNALCLARYVDDEWYRGQVVQTSPELKVLFVDYGETLTVNASDVQPLPARASLAKSVPVLAVQLGLFGLPADIPKEVNQWFANNAIGTTVTVSVVAKGADGKLLVELFEGLLNINMIVREKVALVEHAKTNQDLRVTPLKELLPEEITFISELGEQNKDQNINGNCASDEQVLEKSQNQTLGPVPECEKNIIYEECLNGTPEVLVETPKEINAVTSTSEKIFAYHSPVISHHTSEEMYASCIVGPSYFWCQFAQTENLDTVSRLTQSIGETLKDAEVPKNLDPGSPCLALFSEDSQWYRAQVLWKTDSTVCVVFVDYGNESEVDNKDVRYLPQSLIEHAPQALLCSLDGFDKSKGSWDDQVYEEFYNVLVDQLLTVTVLSAQEHSECAFQEHSVKVQCGGQDLNEAMRKFWKPISTQPENEKIQTASNPPQPSNMTHLEENPRLFSYKMPNIPLNKAEMVYTSCVVEPHFFWCQFADTEDLSDVVKLAQEAGQIEPDSSSSSTFGPGSPCLALFSADEQWYRALIMSRQDDEVHVVFIDYGNESDVDVKNVRPLCQTLQEYTPQAFLCSLNGFDQSKGTWEIEVYDDFYNLLVDKPIVVTVSHIEEYAEMMLPQHVVEINCEGTSVNAVMQKYWKPTS